MEILLVLKSQIPIKKISYVAVQKAAPEINHIHFRTHAVLIIIELQNEC